MERIRQWRAARAQTAGRPRYQTTDDAERDWAAHYEARASEAETEATQDGRPFASQAEYDHYAAQYWEMRRRHDGYKTPLTANQHILHLLLTVVTGGLWGIVWIVRAVQGNRTPR